MFHCGQIVLEFKYCLMISAFQIHHARHHSIGDMYQLKHCQLFVQCFQSSVLYERTEREEKKGTELCISFLRIYTECQDNKLTATGLSCRPLQ